MKALFFLRHYNDIDHITPVISKWLESGHICDIVLIGNPKFHNDYRIKYLNKLNGVKIDHIKELLPPFEFMRWRLLTLLLNQRLRRLVIAPLINTLFRIYHAKKRHSVWQSVSKYLLENCFSGTKGGVVVFDWITKNSPVSLEWVKTVVSTARTMGLGTVSLPHGDSPHANQLIRHGEWCLQPDTMYSAGQIFDKLVVPNELCAMRFRPFMEDESLAVLGSPRYCDEWLAKLSELVPPSPLNRSDSQLKIVIFLRKREFTTFWEEIEEILRMIADFPQTELIIKPHTRGGWKQSLTKNGSLRRLPNIHVAGDDIHSIHLINWADIIIDLATSVAYDAIKAKKPVLAADYLHAGRSTIADFMPEAMLRCRDDVYKKINGFISRGCDSFYIEAHRQRFMQEMIDGPNLDVLASYVSLLETQARKRSVGKAD